MARLRSLYFDEIQRKLMEDLGLSTVMAVPRLKKIVLNMGLGREAVQDSKFVLKAAEQLTSIAGQKVTITKARQSIAGFKVREGMNLGVRVTLRKSRMYEFLDRLVNIALPRIRDFRGLSPKNFDGLGNYGFGIKEQIIFPEIDYDKVDKIRGMDIGIVTTALDDRAGKALLESFNMPFVKQENG